jgi:hypothetical protein
MEEKYIEEYIKSLNSKNTVTDISEKSSHYSISYTSPYFGNWYQSLSIDVDKEVLRQFVRDRKLQDIL